MISIGWPTWPVIERAQPCECHGTITYVTAAAVGVCWHHPRSERLRLAPCHRCYLSCDSPTHYWDFSSNRRELALRADGGCLVLSWNHSKSTPCLLARHKYRNTNHHAAASLPFKFVPAPLGVAHDTNATRPTARTTAPPCSSYTRRTRGTGRADAYEASFVSRVVVVASSSVMPVGCSGIAQNSATTRKRGAPSRNAIKSDPQSSAPAFLRTCLVASFRCDAAAGRPGGRGHFSCLGCFSTTLGWALNHHQAPPHRAGFCLFCSAKQANTRGKPHFVRILRFCLLFCFLETLNHRPPELIKFPMPAAWHENKGNPAIRHEITYWGARQNLRSAGSACINWKQGTI